MNYGLYIHIPFCRTKCPYCAFTSFQYSEPAARDYLATLGREIRLPTGDVFDGNPHTVYIGGGTPSLVSGQALARLLAMIPLDDAAECTIEANPESVTPRWFESVRNLGIDRISIGVQSLDTAVLATLGRIHSAEQAETAVLGARSASFRSVSVDLMFGVPYQTAEQWERTLERTIAFRPDHISCYSLGIETDTAYFTRFGGVNNEMGDDLCADMYETAVTMLRNAGYARYEVSNFARPGHECLHNLGYWHFSPYRGVGISAHSYNGSRRWWNTSGMKSYTGAVERGHLPVEGREACTGTIYRLERLMVGLRLTGGVHVTEITGGEIQESSPFLDRVKRLAADGYLEMHGGTITLSDKGFIISDELIGELAAALDENPGED